MIEDFIPPLAYPSSVDSSQVLRRSGLTMNPPSSALLAEGGVIASSEKDGQLYVKASDVAAALASAKSPGQKFDGGKAPLAQGFAQYFGKAAAGVALISAYGAQKYKVQFSDQNWRKVDNAKGRYADALLRHLMAHLRGEINDPESGLPHVDHMAWNAMALSELEKA